MNDGQRDKKLAEIKELAEKLTKPLDELEKARELLPEGKENNLIWYHLGKARLQVMLALSRMCGEDTDDS